MAETQVSHKPFYMRSPRRVKFLQRLFTSWHRILSQATVRLARCKDPDCPYRYGEASHVGLLALAAYEMNTKWFPLQEPTIKRKGSRDRKAKGNQERTDLWLFKGRGRKATVIDVEAKDLSFDLFTIRCAESFSSAKKVKNKLLDAVAQAKNKRTSSRKTKSVGLVFVRIYKQRNVTEQALRHLLKVFKQTATSKHGLKSVGADFLALYIADRGSIRRVSEADESESEKVCIGVAVIGKMLV